MIKLWKSGFICTSRIGASILSAKTRTIICRSPFPEGREWWSSSDWRRIDTEERWSAVVFDSKISKENFHVQASLLRFVFPYGMLIAWQSHFSSWEEWRQSGHGYQKQMVFRGNDQIKKPPTWNPELIPRKKLARDQMDTWSQAHAVLDPWKTARGCQIGRMPSIQQTVTGASVCLQWMPSGISILPLLKSHFWPCCRRGGSLPSERWMSCFAERASWIVGILS